MNNLGKILNVTYKEDEDVLYICIVRITNSSVVPCIQWLSLNKDEWNSEGYMNKSGAQLERFDRMELFKEVYEFYKETVGIHVAKHNMTIFGKYLDMENKNNV